MNYLEDILASFETQLRSLIETVFNIEVAEPLWLLLVAVPLLTAVIHFVGRFRKVVFRFRNDVVKELTVVKHSKWRRHLAFVILTATMLALVIPAANPVETVKTTRERALIIWIYDASESMDTVDVSAGDDTISRFEASIQALEDSQSGIPDEYHKMLVSFAGVQEISVRPVTLSSSELLTQAQTISRGSKTATDFALERAVSACSQFFGSEDNYPCEIFLLSDGECNPRPQCQARAEAIAGRAAQAGIVINTVSWGDPSSSFRPSAEDMLAIAEQGQGRHLATADTAELTQLYQDVATDLVVEVTRHGIGDFWKWAFRVIIVALFVVFWLRRFDH